MTYISFWLITKETPSTYLSLTVVIHTTILNTAILTRWDGCLDEGWVVDRNVTSAAVITLVYRKPSCCLEAGSHSWLHSSLELRYCCYFVVRWWGQLDVANLLFLGYTTTICWYNSMKTEDRRVTWESWALWTTQKYSLSRLCVVDMEARLLCATGTRWQNNPLPRICGMRM